MLPFPQLLSSFRHQFSSFPSLIRSDIAYNGIFGSRFVIAREARFFNTGVGVTSITPKVYRSATMSRIQPIHTHETEARVKSFPTHSDITIVSGHVLSTLTWHPTYQELCLISYMPKRISTICVSCQNFGLGANNERRVSFTIIPICANHAHTQ